MIDLFLRAGQGRDFVQTGTQGRGQRVKVVDLDIHAGEVIGLVIETHCNYFSPLAFPRNVEAGIRVAHIGKSSVRYEIGLFEQGVAQSAASGHFVHVYVDRVTRRPTELPEAFVQALKALQVPAAA